MKASTEKLFHTQLEGAKIEVGGSRPWDIRIHDSRTYRRIVTGGSLGAGEAYMDGWWDVEALDEFFARLLRARLHRGLRRGGFVRNRLLPLVFNPQSRRLSRRVAETHYDLGNDFYEAMLDSRWMQYTCAYWKSTDTLEAAQEAKLDLVCRKLKLRPGERVLELGGGWGGFARYAAEKYGVSVTVYNISKQQVAWAREHAGTLPVTYHLQDYRDAEGIYDKVVSIGLCEHVGWTNLAAFLALKAKCLKDDGLALLHTIGSNVTKTWSDPWFTRYIFPGGALPSLPQVTRAAEPHFVLEDLHNLGADYDPTLMAWHANFEKAWPRFASRYGERFRRMWRYYLLASAGAFRARNIQLWQFVFSKKGVPGGYEPER